MIVPDSITPVEGWRAWYVDGDEKLLKSIYYGGTWTPMAVKEAECGVGSLNTDTFLLEIFLRETLIHSAYITAGMSYVFNFNAYENWSGLTQIGVQFDGDKYVPWAYTEQGLVTDLFDFKFTEVANPKFKKHKPVSKSCACGIYAANSLKELHNQYPDFLLSVLLHHNFVVLGKIKGWGRVQTGFKGWRAQYAYPEFLVTSSRQAKKVAAKYGVPILTTTQLKKDYVW